MNYDAPTFSERIRMFLADRRVRFGGAAVVLIAALAFAGVTVSEKRAEAARRARCTQRAKGLIDHERTVPVTAAPFPWLRPKHPRYRVAYDFEVNGVTYAGESIWPFRPQGKHLAVNYDPTDPATSFADYERAPDF